MTFMELVDRHFAAFWTFGFFVLLAAFFCVFGYFVTNRQRAK